MMKVLWMIAMILAFAGRHEVAGRDVMNRRLRGVDGKDEVTSRAMRGHDDKPSLRNVAKEVTETVMHDETSLGNVEGVITAMTVDGSDDERRELWKDEPYAFLVSNIGYGMKGYAKDWCITADHGVHEGVRLGFKPCDFKHASARQLWQLDEYGRIHSKLNPHRCIIVNHGTHVVGGTRLRMADCDKDYKLGKFIHNGGTDLLRVEANKKYCVTNTGSHPNPTDFMVTEQCENKADFKFTYKKRRYYSSSTSHHGKGSYSSKSHHTSKYSSKDYSKGSHSKYTSPSKHHSKSYSSKYHSKSSYSYKTSYDDSKYSPPDYSKSYSYSTDDDYSYEDYPSSDDYGKGYGKGSYGKGSGKGSYSKSHSSKDYSKSHTTKHSSKDYSKSHTTKYSSKDYSKSHYYSSDDHPKYKYTVIKSTSKADFHPRYRNGCLVIAQKKAKNGQHLLLGSCHDAHGWRIDKNGKMRSELNDHMCIQAGQKGPVNVGTQLRVYECKDVALQKWDYGDGRLRLSGTSYCAAFHGVTGNIRKDTIVLKKCSDDTTKWGEWYAKSW